MFGMNSCCQRYNAQSKSVKDQGHGLFTPMPFVIPLSVNLKIYSETDFPPYLPKLNLLYDDLFHGGKGFRAKLTQMISDHLSLPQETIHLLCQTIEFIHNSSLLHDDLVDRSSLRRGKTTAWLKYSPEYAVLAGDYLLARVMVNLANHGNVELIKLTSVAISDLLEGEWLQDDLVKKRDVTLSQMDRVHTLKTGSLFKWCLRAPFFANQEYSPIIHQELERAGEILGLLLQRSDDLLDFNIRNFEQKNIMGDLKAGYVNSFCAFLFLEKTAEERLKLSQISDLEDFKKSIGSHYFNEKQKDFDVLNVNLIQAYQHSLERLKKSLPPSQQNVCDDLAALPDPLYWRKSD